MSTTLGERIKRRLSDLGRRQTDLATACGVKPPSVSDWINGNTKQFDADNLLLSADFLNVSPKWLLWELGPMQNSLAPATSNFSNVYELRDNSSYYGRDSIVKIIKLLEKADEETCNSVCGYIEVYISQKNSVNGKNVSISS